MFYSLPIETKLDILKFLSYEELWSVNETNLYFRDFISKYEDELAQEEFYKISFDCVNKFEKDPRRLIKLKTKNFDFPVNEQFEEIVI
uniref:F-box domain-containing protein n=1 Tax=Meloidogyne enterolobii TaxID=390850 RepID=A0A6V7VZQ1_MELEN|nr:unnamed protein product [Meloidogyne enterolobii]